jgi:serine/threonine-protein kinase
LQALSAERYVSAYDISLVYLGLGEKDQALEWLGKSLIERSNWMVWLKADPMFDSLRSEPRFEQLVRDVGLLEQG